MKKENALYHFAHGFNCSQAVIAAYCEDYGLELEKAVNLSAGFGGGIGRQGKICGCASGALMVLGLKYGQNSTKDSRIKKMTYDLTKNFCRDFSETNGALDCKEIIANNPNKTEDRCNRVLANTIDLLEDYLKR